VATSGWFADGNTALVGSYGDNFDGAAWGLDAEREKDTPRPYHRMEIERSSAVLTTTAASVRHGFFPSAKSTLRLVGAILLEQDHEWAVAERRYFTCGVDETTRGAALSPIAQELLSTIA
jgi:hypothetical protein